MLRIRESRVMITGYTDRIGPLDHNMGLSKRRAHAVGDYLTNLGLGAAEMEVAGKGPANPLVACEGKRGSALVDGLAPNRRTEIEFSAFEMVEKRR